MKILQKFILVFIAIHSVVIYFCVFHHDKLVSKPIENKPWIKYHFINVTGQYSNISELESLVFSLDNLEKKTDPINGQLLYADYVQYVRNYTISKINYSSQYPSLTTIIFVLSRVDAFEQRVAVRQT